MKKAIALLLALIMVMSLFAGCGKEKAPAFDTTALEAGTYEVVDDDETVAVLVSTGKKLTVYGADGEDGEILMDETKFSYDEDEEAFMIDDEEAFSLSYEDGVITINVPKKSPLGIKKGDYTLKTEGGEKEEEEAEGSAAELAKGWYALVDDEGETCFYLYSTGKKVTAYDDNMEELMSEAKFAYDEDEEAFVIDDTAAFSLTVEKKTTTINVPKKSPLGIDKGDYTLEACEEPTDNGEAPTPAGTDPEPAATENNNVRLPDGIYEATVYGYVAFYYRFSGDQVTMIDLDGVVDSEANTVVYAADNSCTIDETTTVVFTDNGDGTYNMLMTEGSDSLEVTLRPIDESELPATAISPDEDYAVVTRNGKTLYTRIPVSLCNIDPYNYEGSSFNYVAYSGFVDSDYSIMLDFSYQLNDADSVFADNADGVLAYLRDYYNGTEYNITKTTGWNFTSNDTEWRWRLDWIQADSYIKVTMMLISVDGIAEVTATGYAYNNTEADAQAIEDLIVNAVANNGGCLYIK